MRVTPPRFITLTTQHEGADAQTCLMFLLWLNRVQARLCPVEEQLYIAGQCDRL